MKAIRVHKFGGPEVLQFEEIPTPIPGPDQLLIRVRAAGVNPVDTYIRSGTYAASPALPYIPGRDAAGMVESVGANVREFQAGDRVYVGAAGAYAEFLVCAPNQAHRLPEKISFAQGAGIFVPYATAYRALLQRAKALPGEVVLIHGASGGVGVAAVQLARAAGLIVIGTGGTEPGRALVREQGAHHVLDHRDPNSLKEVLNLTGGRGVDVIVEMLSNVNLGKDLALLAKGGRIAVVGSRGPVEINPRDAMVRDAVILGVMLDNASESEQRAIHAAIGAGLEQGSLRPVVGRELPLAEAARAHAAVLEPGAFGKIVLKP